MHLSPATSLARDPADYVIHFKNALPRRPSHRLGIFRNSDKLRRRASVSTPDQGGYISPVTPRLCSDTQPLSSTCTTTSDSKSTSVNAPFIQSAYPAMSSDYEYSDDDGDYYDEDELMDEDDQGECRLTPSLVPTHNG